MRSIAVASLALSLTWAIGSSSAFAEEQSPTAQVIAETEQPHQNVGFGNEVFFLRSDDDNFILIPSGRFQYDFYGYEGGANQPFNQFQPKRVRLEVMGTFMKHRDFQLGSELTGGTPAMTDVFVNVNYTNYANVQLGQFDAPFTMENRTSDKWTDLQERSVLVRTLGIPENKEIGGMVWGQPDGKWAYWSAGVFNGEGMNVLQHRSNNFDFMGRAWIAPFGVAGVTSAKNVWVGGSAWVGSRHAPLNNQVDRLGMKDQAGFTFFNPVSGSLHTGDFGRVTKWAVELNAPLGPFVLKGEYVHTDENMREIDMSTASAPALVRKAKLEGGGFYTRMSYFVWGDPLINGLAGTQIPPRLFGALKPPKTDTALQLVVEYDRLRFDYLPGAAAEGVTAADKFAGEHGLDTIAVGVNYWHTKHIRLTTNFLYNTFLGDGPRPLISSKSSYEVTFRTALAL